MRIASIVILVILVAILIWWFASDNATAPVIDNTVQYNQDASAFSKFFFKLDCALVRSGEYNGADVSCDLNN